VERGLGRAGGVDNPPSLRASCVLLERVFGDRGAPLLPLPLSAYYHGRLASVSCPKTPRFSRGGPHGSVPPLFPSILTHILTSLLPPSFYSGFVSSPEMMAKLQGKADELPPGTILITTSVPLTTESYGGKRSPRSNWETLSTEGCLQMSWGRGVAYIQRKIRDVPLFKSDARLDQIVNVAWAKPQDEGHRLRWPYCHAAFTELLVPVQMKPENTTQTLAPSVCVASTPERRRTTGLLYTGVAGSFIGRLC